MKKRTKNIFVACITAMVLAAAIGAGDYYRTFYKDNVVEGASDSLYVKIYGNYSFDELCAAMEESGALCSSSTFSRAARHMKLDKGFKAGYYRFREGGMSNKEIVRMLANGWQTPIRISFTGYIRSMGRFAKILSTQLEADSASFCKVLTDSVVMAKHGFDSLNFIGMFIPDTYEFYWTVSPEEFVARMSREYEAFWTKEREEKAAKAGLTRQQVSTLASIVIEETKYVPEMPTIAGVYINRLRKGIPLQADPTVKYALNMKGITRILNKHLKVVSPYNTYRIKGLPPGPITMPPAEAIDAVLNYQHHNYIYFCARETFDGRHNFATTMAQHRANARAYHRALDQRARKKAQGGA